MNKFLLPAAALVLMGSAAIAADLSSPKTETALPPPPPPMWHGFYAGLNAGYGWGTNKNPDSSQLNAGSWSVTTRVIPGGAFTYGSPFVGSALATNGASLTQSGFIGGGQFGYNFQFKETFVAGFEADFQGADFRGGSTGFGHLNGSSTDGTPAVGIFGLQNGAFANSLSAGLDYLGTARGRLGFLLKPNLLIFATGGLAYGGAWANVATYGASTITPYAYQTGSPTAPYPAAAQSYVGGGRSNTLLVGYSAGGGVEWMFMRNWSLKAEAFYYNLGSLNVSTCAVANPANGQILINQAANAISRAYSGPGAINGFTSVNYQGVIARAGVNYHFDFNGAAPIVER